MIPRKERPFYLGPAPIVLGIAVFVAIAVVVASQAGTSSGQTAETKNGVSSSDQSPSLALNVDTRASSTPSATATSTASANPTETPVDRTNASGASIATVTPVPPTPTKEVEAAAATPTATDTETPSPTATSTATTTPTPTATTPSSSGGASMNAEASQLLTLINQYRAQNGRAAWSVNGNLVASAQAFAKDQGDNDYFSLNHLGRNGSTPCSRMAAAGYTGQWRGEDLNAGQLTPQESLDAWIASAPHRAILLDPTATEAGVGYYLAPNSTYGTYWVLDIGSQPKQQSC